MVVNIRQLRSSTREILSTVERGGQVLISNRGKACARIVPVSETTGHRPFSLAGLWKDNKKVADVRGFIRKLREPRHAR